MAYFIAIVLIFLKVLLMVDKGMNISSSDFSDGMCVVAMAHAVIIIRGSTFHPLVLRNIQQSTYTTNLNELVHVLTHH